MKLVKEHINEYNFQRGLDPKDAMGIGVRAQIVKWFDDLGISSGRYTINDKLNIKFSKDLYLNNTKITSLPDNLSVGGYLDLSNTKITSLPDNLSVGKYLDLNNTKITSLPDNLSVGGYLDLSNTKITNLPDNLSVGGDIYKDF